MNYYIIIPLGIAAIVLIIFLIRRNFKDEKEYEKFSNNDYSKEHDEDYQENCN